MVIDCVPPRSPYFYPRPHMEGDIFGPEGIIMSGLFLPTPSHGGRRLLTFSSNTFILFLPTPSHGGRLVLGVGDFKRDE